MIVPRSLIDAYEAKIREKNALLARWQHTNEDLYKSLGVTQLMHDRTKDERDRVYDRSRVWFYLFIAAATSALALGFMWYKAHNALVQVVLVPTPVVDNRAVMELPPSLIVVDKSTEVTEL